MKIRHGPATVNDRKDPLKKPLSNNRWEGAAEGSPKDRQKIESQETCLNRVSRICFRGKAVEQKHSVLSNPK